MQEADGARELDVAGADQEPLAAHAAQGRQLVARGEPAAVDTTSVRPRRLRQASPSTHLGSGGAHGVEQEGQRVAASPYALRREKRARREAPGEIGLERRRSPAASSVAVALGQLRETRELGLVAGRRDDEAAGVDERRIGVAPERKPAPPHVAHDHGRRLGLAVRARAWRRRAGSRPATNGSALASMRRTPWPRRASVSACQRPRMPAPTTVMRRAP